MGSDGFQITIPDFDEEEFSTTPIPFGRTPAFGGGGFGVGNGSFGGFGGSGSGQNSPTATTPMPFSERADRSYFHSRQESITSDDSNHSGNHSANHSMSHSTRYTPSRANTSQTSVATTSTSPFSKKPSFASIRNAFKSAKVAEAPPVPQIDHQAYPVMLKNPFNRSTSSLAQTSAPTLRKASVTASPPQPRAQTPLSRTTPKSRNHSYAKSQHSQSGSIFQTSENGSDLGHGTAYASSPPPVPRVPNAFGGQGFRSETPAVEYDDNVVMNPSTPAEYALHAVLLRFATSAEMKIDAFLRNVLDRDPPLPDTFGPEVDSKFDDVLTSLGKIAQRNSKPVVNSILRWAKTQTDDIPSDVVRLHTAQSPVANRGGVQRAPDIFATLRERKSMASVYIMCRALITVLQSIGKDALGDILGGSLEAMTFDQFKRPDLKLLAQSANQRINADLFATVLGYLANIRFQSVTDLFLSELNPVASGQVPKDLDMKYEYLVKGIRHIQIKVWPPEAFEEAAEFMESLSKSFEHAHGLRLKTAFAETLVSLLHPMGKTAQAEVNHPQWAKAIETIYPKAKDMMTKPRYWHVAYPLAITSLCVAPHQYFLRNWTACFEAGLTKLKEKPYRVPVMNGMMRLIWTYMYRCQEPASTTTSKLDALMKQFFPPNRISVFPPDESPEPFIIITHFISARHVDYGREMCMELLQESAIRAAQSTNIVNLLAPERMDLALQAILMTLHGIEREEPTPTWPSSSDFSATPALADYPSSSSTWPITLISKPGISEFSERCGVTLAAIAVSCGNAVGCMSVFDEQWSAARANASSEEASSWTTRRHPEGTVVYPNYLYPQISMLHACFRSWPRFLHSSLAIDDAIDLLVHGVIHVEPQVGEAASAALKRFMADPPLASMVLLRLTNFLFDAEHISKEGSGLKLIVESTRLLGLWKNLVEGWALALTQRDRQSVPDDEVSAIIARVGDIEVGALFLLSFDTRTIRSIGVKVAVTLATLTDYIFLHLLTDEQRAPRILDLLRGKDADRSYLSGFDELLDQTELERLIQWRLVNHADVLLRLADSELEKDRKLWRFVFPAFTRLCIAHSPQALLNCRKSLVAASSRYHPLVSHCAGLSSKVPVVATARGPLPSRDGQTLVRENKPMIDQWSLWVKILCCTASLSETRPAITHANRDHTRAPSDANYERERMTTTRGLFRYLTPFLDSDFTPFRDAAVVCISCFPTEAYPQLLEDLNLLSSRQFYDDPRAKAAGSPALSSSARTRRQERLHSAVARTYYLTAPSLQHQRSAARQASLTHVLKSVRTTQSFLSSPEMRDNYSLQRLRRYFCGTVERLFDGLATLADSDRFIPRNMHLALYRMCEEWCQPGSQSETVKHRLILMQRGSAASAKDPRAGSEVSIELFRRESKLLSDAAVGALASLCQKAYFPPDVAAGSPTERSFLDYLKPLDAVSTLDRLDAILASTQPILQVHGRRGLRSLLAFHSQDSSLMDEALRRSFVNSDDRDSSCTRFFGVVSDVVCSADVHGFTFSQLVCLGLSNLCHPDHEIRRNAFDMLETTHEQSSGILSLSHFESAIGSSSPSTYTHAHRLISDCLAGEHPQQAGSALSQFSIWLTHLHRMGGHDKLVLLLLQSLEGWIPNINLMTDNKSNLSSEGLSALYHLVALTARYGRSHAEQVLVLWTRVVDAPHQSNGHAAVRFLLEQSHKVGSNVFISCAANIVACLSQTAIGKQIFQDLCSVIEPARMLPTIEHKLSAPTSEDVDLWSDLDALFADQPHLSLGAAQFAWLFLTDVALERQWEMQSQLPVLLHVLFSHIDHKQPFVRQQARVMLFQLLRSWTSGYDELPDRATYPTRAALKSSIAHLEAEAESLLWKEDEANAEVEVKMQRLTAEVLHILEPLAPHLAEDWGSLALVWGTSCSIRAIAFRSLQIFRALMPPITKADLSQLLARLSNTIAAPDAFLRSFTSEIILTLIALAKSPDLDPSLVALMFWCACASLSTTVEDEFSQILQLLTAVLKRIDLDDYHTAEHLVSQRPPDWIGSASLQASLLTGLRSSTTAKATIETLKLLAKYDDSRMIDPSDGRVRDLYTLSLPWCLNTMGSESEDLTLQDFAMDIARLAEAEGRVSISRIMTSFVKKRFRTKEDFLRQSVSSLREHYGADHWTEVVTLLLGLVLNNEKWLRLQSLQILKVLFQQRETRSPVDLLGSELLMPLLRLVEGDLASQALEVLEEPMNISGGPSAKQVLRMSMHMKTFGEVEPAMDIFGMPEESGWCIARSETVRHICRTNLMAVFDTCKMPSRPSRIEFEPELDARVLSTSLDEDLGDLVQNLHELTSFFSNPVVDQSTAQLPLPSHQLEARVAAILAKSTEMPTADIPETPFMDVFRVGGGSISEDDDEYSSDEESEMDAFIFDTPAAHQRAPNGFHLH